ncbi:MAG: glutamine amidotransferase [Pirellulaceae bacterium]|nr:glutamine amidotransferase [Pirellulaceae bacterium]
MLASIEFDGVRHGWLWLVLIIAGAGVLCWTYRGIYLRSGRNVTWGLMALRAAGLLALVLAIAKPTWTDDNESVDPGHLAVVLDNSLSMSLEGRFAKATVAVNELRDQIESDRSGPRVAVDIFDLTGTKITGDVPKEPRQERTDLAKATSEALGQLRSKLLVGLVLVSDGVDNTGQEGAARLADAGTPIHSIGFHSDTAASRLDLEVGEPQAPPRVMVDNEIKVTIPVSKSAGPQLVATVTVRRGGEEFARERVTLAEGTVEQLAPITFTPTEAGSFVFTASVSSDTGEQLLANNSRHFPLQVDADAIGVLYLEGFLRYEYKYLKNRLEDDPDVSLVSVVRRTNPERVDLASGETLITPERLENLDLVILGDMEGDYLSEGEYEALKNWVDEGHALLVLGGYYSFGADGFRNTPLASVLPVVFSNDGVEQSEEPFVLNLTQYGRQHPIFEITGDSVNDLAFWNTAPQLLGSSLVARAKAGAEVLAVNPNITIDGQPAVVITTGRYGSGRTMVVTADTTWRWTRLTRVAGKSDTLYSRFWSQTIRWLTGRDIEEKRSQLVVSTNRPDYEVGKEVSIRLRRQAEWQSGEAGRVAVEVVDGAGKRIPIELRSGSAEPNLFVASFYPSSSGRFEVNASLTSEGKTVANQTAEFLVHGSDLELADTGTNRSLLKSISQKSGGVYVDVEDTSRLADSIERKERRNARTERTEYWDSPFLFLLFIAAVSGEWILRRKNHLV